MDLQSSLEAFSKSLEIVSKIQEIFSRTDVKFWVGILSLVGVIYTVRNTRENVNNTNNLKKELEDQANNLKQELADQTNEITKELGEKNLKALEQRRYIDAISTERVKWINTVRDAFSEYNKAAYIQINFLTEKEILGGSKLEPKLTELIYWHYHVELFLNPVEPITKKFVEIKQETTKALHTDFPLEDIDYDEVASWVADLHYLQQVILKAEWKRVKEENNLGKEITDKDMHEIFNKTAERMDKKRYKSIFKNGIE